MEESKKRRKEKKTFFFSRAMGSSMVDVKGSGKPCDGSMQCLAGPGSMNPMVQRPGSISSIGELLLLIY